MREQNYSFARALQFLADPSNEVLRRSSRIERAASEALSNADNGGARGLIVPGDVFTRQSTQTGAEGGALVGQAATGFAGAVRAALVAGQAGATVITGLQADASIPTIETGASAYWLQESLAGASDVTDSTPVMGRGLVSPKTVAASVPVSRRLMLQGQPDVAGVIAADVIAALGHAIDAAALGASGDPNAPDGLIQALAARKVTLAGSVPTWSELLDLEQDVMDGNGTDPAFIISPAMARALKEAETVTGSGRHVLSGGMIADRRALITSSMPATTVLAGQFSDLVICMWGGIDLRLDAGTSPASDTRILRAFADVGFLTRRVSSFAYGAPA